MENKTETFHLRSIEDSHGDVYISLVDVYNYLEILSLQNPKITARDVKYLLKNMKFNGRK